MTAEISAGKNASPFHLANLSTTVADTRDSPNSLNRERPGAARHNDASNVGRELRQTNTAALDAIRQPDNARPRVYRCHHNRPATPAIIRLLLVDDHRVVRKGFAALLGSEPDFQVVGQQRSATARQFPGSKSNAAIGWSASE